MTRMVNMRYKILLLAIILFVFRGTGCFGREKRYLVFPIPNDSAPTKVQGPHNLYSGTSHENIWKLKQWYFAAGCGISGEHGCAAVLWIAPLILGLGLPMEVDVSMIIGYVMKFNYVLPYNASYLTDSYIRYDRSISSGVEADEDGGHSLDHQDGVDHVVSRWEIYEILESVLGDSQTGKACLLRAICETSAVPFTGVHGLSSQLVHLLLTPSMTSEPFRTDFDRMYHAAEMLGQSASWNCDSLFPECEESPLEYFTEVYG